MPTNTQKQNLALEVRRTLNAPVAKVFNAWTDPQQLKQWFRPTPQHKTVLAEVDLRVGGRYRIRMEDPANAPHTVVGTFKEIIPNKKLVYTWTFEEAMGDLPDANKETLITLEFKEAGAKTDLYLKHEHFTDENSRDMHTHGWNGCLTSLEGLLAH